MEVPEKQEVEGDTIPTRRIINVHYHGSDLYDSFEFRQMTHQLNMVMQASSSSSPAYHEMRDKMKKAVQGSHAASPTYLFRLNSPLYRHQMSRIYKENVRTPRRISGQNAADKGSGGGRRRARVKGFVARLWMKVKQGFLGNNGENDGVGK